MVAATLSSRTRAAAAALALAAALASCAPAPGPAPWARVREITPAALEHVVASDPSLAVGPHGRLALTWVTRDDEGTGVWLAVSSDSGTRFGEPRRLDEPPGRVASYPESRPVAAFGPTGQLVVLWAERRDSTRWADDIVARASVDGGTTFDPPVFVNDDHGDPASTYHGFVSLAFAPDGRAYAAWLDGRGQPPGPGMDEPLRASVRLSSSVDEGRSWAPSTLVAPEACPCCRVALRADSLGRLAVAYRGARNDLRDPRLAVSHDGGASFPFDTLVADDRWKLPGCPSVGPAITANRAGGGLYAWFTGAERPADDVEPGVWVAAWRLDAGRTGPRRALADSLRDASHPMLAALGTTTLVAAIARPAADSTTRVLAVRALDPDRAMTPWLFLGANVRSAAVAGMGPRLAFAAWVERSDGPPRLRLARLHRR